MKPIPRISEAEWEVLTVLWERSPRTASQVFAALGARAWKLTTVRTFLARLSQKGVIAGSSTPEGRVFSPVLSREECVQEASQSFLDRVFGGAAGSLLLHFARRQRLSSTELAELEAILKQQKKGR